MKYLSVFVSILFSFLILEIYSRLIIDNGMNYEFEMMKYARYMKVISSNKEVGIEHKKNVEKKLMGAQVKLDSNGFRILNNSYEKKKILMIGDSMTFGWGAKKPFANKLNELINDYHVINGGIGNTNTIMQIENFFENHKSLYNYEVIVLNFYINDFERVNINKPHILEKYSYFYTFFFNKMTNLLIRFKLKDNWQNFYEDTFLDESFKNKTLQKIVELKKYCDNKNIKFIIHNIPQLRNLKNYGFTEQTKIIENFAKENEIIFLNSINALSSFKEEELWVSKEDPHANDKAHDIISQYLVDKLIDF